MRYAGLIANDMVNGEGVCVSFWTQGCPHRCPGCHNPETCDFDGGMEVPTDIKATLKAKIRIIPIEAVEDFDLEISLEDSFGETTAVVNE